jgi:hypothetical protein
MVQEVIQNRIGITMRRAVLQFVVLDVLHFHRLLFLSSLSPLVCISVNQVLFESAIDIDCIERVIVNPRARSRR